MVTLSISMLFLCESYVWIAIEYMFIWMSRSDEGGLEVCICGLRSIGGVPEVAQI
jgi:hypothetical protein